MKGWDKEDNYIGLKRLRQILVKLSRICKEKMYRNLAALHMLGRRVYRGME